MHKRREDYRFVAAGWDELQAVWSELLLSPLRFRGAEIGARSLAHQGLYDVADREFWEVAIAAPNIEAWRVANGRDIAELIAKTPDLQAAVAFLQ